MHAEFGQPTVDLTPHQLFAKQHTSVSFAPSGSIQRLFEFSAWQFSAENEQNGQTRGANRALDPVKFHHITEILEEL
jgi:hypothetical protein